MNLKYTFLLIFLSILIFGCGLPDRIMIGRVITNTEKIRDAEKLYKQKFGNGNYASIEQLIEKDLLEEKFSDGIEYGYKFSLEVEKNRYRLSVTPEQKIKDVNENRIEVEQLSLYVDETGVIRASVKASKPADSESHPINPK